MLNYEKISIITPNYNGAAYLEETIQSVLNQGYSNLEYIIIDGGSTDGSVDIIRKYEKQITYWVSEPDAGLYHAIQKGFEISTGDIMAWINSDDKYHHGAFSIVSELFSQFPQIEWLQGIPSTFDEKGRTVSIQDYKRWSRINYYSRDYQWIQQESVFWRRALWVKAGNYINTKLKYAADFELWMRFFRHAELYTVKSLIGGFRYSSGNQISINNKDHYIAEVEDVINRELEILPIDYLHKLLAILNFEMRLRSFRLRVFKSVYFRWNYKKIKGYQIELYKYPPIIDFDPSIQKFFISSRI